MKLLQKLQRLLEKDMKDGQFDLLNVQKYVDEDQLAHHLKTKGLTLALNGVEFRQIIQLVNRKYHLTSPFYTCFYAPSLKAIYLVTKPHGFMRYPQHYRAMAEASVDGKVEIEMVKPETFSEAEKDPDKLDLHEF